MKREHLWEIFFFFISLLVALAMGEGLARIWIANAGDALHRARRVITTDPLYAWKQRASLDTDFEGLPLYTDRDGFRQSSPSARADTQPPKVLTLGPSSAFGWGVRFDETYTAVASQKSRMTAFNAGQIGYSLTQGRRLYGELRLDSRFKDTKIVVIAYGINDLDRFRFFGPGTSTEEDDEAYFMRDLHADLAWDKFATGLAFLELLVRTKSELIAATRCGVDSVPTLRLPIPRFLDSLRQLIRDVRADKRRPVIINTPYKQHPSADPDTSNLAYQNSAEAHRLNRCREARHWVLQARLAEPERIAKDVVRLNAGLAIVAKSENLAIVDAHQILSRDPTMFFDPIHPSTEGHRRIASQLALILNETVDFNGATTEPDQQ